MEIQYRESRPGADDYWRLYATTGWNKKYRLSQQDLGQAVGNSWCVVAAYDGSLLIGAGRVVSDGVLHAMVYELITDPVYQGRGVGTEILARLVAKCRQAHIRDIQLFSAQGKRSFYEKRGFRVRQEDSPGMEFVPPRAAPVR